MIGIYYLNKTFVETNNFFIYKNYIPKGCRKQSSHKM